MTKEQTDKLINELVCENRTSRKTMEKINKNINILVIVFVWIPICIAVVYGFYLGMKLNDLI